MINENFHTRSIRLRWYWLKSYVHSLIVKSIFIKSLIILYYIDLLKFVNKKKKKKEEKIWKELFSNKKKKIHIYDEDSQKDDLKRSLNSDNKLFGTLLWGNDIKKKKRKKFSRVDPSLFIDDIRHWCNDLFSFIGNYYFTSLKILSHVSLYLYLSFFTPSFLQQVFFLFFFFTLL